jgi:hypothetical protein
LIQRCEAVEEKSEVEEVLQSSAGAVEEEHEYVAIRGKRNDSLERAVAVLVDWGSTLSWEPVSNFQNHADVDKLLLRICELDKTLRRFEHDVMEPRFSFMAGIPMGEEARHLAEKLEGTFVCQPCAKSYRALRSLRKHQNSHGRPLVGIDTESTHVCT